MYLTQKNILKKLNKQDYMILRKITKLSKNLYNVTNWTIREYYRLNGKYLRYERAYHLIKTNENYKQMPSQVAQHCMKVVDRSFRSFFAILKKKQKGRYNKPANQPSFLPKDAHFLCIFPKDSFKIINNKMLRLSMGLWFYRNVGIRYVNIPFPKNIIGHKVKEIRLIPKNNARYFEIEYIYIQEVIPTDLDKQKKLGIDLGLNNFATCVDTNGNSFILNGKGLKSYNRWWNKQKAQLQSIYDLQKIKRGSKMYFMNRRRKHIIRNFMSQNAQYIIKHCLKHKIGKIIIGEMKEIKQHINIGKRNNQHFWSIPYYQFKQKLKYKCELYGIEFHEVNEAYTSQTCWKCGIVKKSNRKYRGLYVCKCGNVSNADTNGAINIMQKVSPKSAKIGSRGGVNPPEIVNVVAI